MDRQRTWDVWSPVVASGPVYADVVVATIGRFTPEIEEWSRRMGGLVGLHPWITAEDAEA